MASETCHKPATEKALKLPELLIQIFSACPKGSLPAFARTCRAWEMPALIQVWHTLRSPHPLFSLLGKMTRGRGNAPAKFVRPVDPYEWPRFQRYASMIHILYYNFASRTDSDTLEEIVMSGYVHDIRILLPHLMAIYIRVHDVKSWRCMPALLSPTLVQATIVILGGAHEESNDRGAGPQLFFRRLPQHSPLLKSLRITTPPEQILSFEAILATLLSSLPLIEDVTLDPPYAVGPAVWAALSSSRNLQELSSIAENGTFPPEAPGEFQPVFGEHTFPELQCITLGFGVQALTLLFNSAPNNLSDVNLSLCGVRTPRDISDCISAVASNCRSLVQFRLLDRSGALIGIDQILPILLHSELEHLALILSHNLQDSDLERIALALPNLSSLHLAPPMNPLQPITSALTLTSLSSLAMHCPALESLTICVSTSSPSAPYRDNYSSLRFKSLCELNFGSSRIAANDSFDIAIFLGDICVEGTTISIAPYNLKGFYIEQTPNGLTHQMSAVIAQWNGLNRMMDIIQARLRDARRGARAAD